jgi:transcriptional regulator with XRE-family HTH domain
MSTYSQRIKEILYKKGLNIKEFCIKIGMNSPNTIQLIIRENRKPSYKTVNKIMTAFPDINYEWLMEGEIKQNSNLPKSMSGDEDLTVTAKQVINQLDINNKHYTTILDKKMSDDRDYYDSVTKSNNSNYSKNIEIILSGFQGLVEKFDKSNKYWSEQNKELKDLFLLTLDKVLHIEQDLENIKSFMAIGFEKQAIKKADKKTAKKLLTKKLEKKKT